MLKACVIIFYVGGNTDIYHILPMYLERGISLMLLILMAMMLVGTCTLLCLGWF